MSDLVIPRVAWLKVMGLSFIAASEQVLKSLIAIKGTLIGITPYVEEVYQSSNVKICISTKSFDNIRITREVSIDNQIFTVVVQEDSRDSNSSNNHAEEILRHSVTSWMESIDFS